MQPAAILFDFDGVLVDSLPLHVAAWRKANIEVFGQDLSPETLASLLGRSTKAIAALLAKAHRAPLKAQELAELKKDILRQNSQPVPLIPGVRELLNSIRDRKLPHAIVSNAPREFIRSTLAAHDLEFELFFGIEDYKRPKPAPDPYLMGAKALGVPFTLHRQTVVFEDSTHGLKAAVAAKMYPIGVLTQHKADQLLDGGAKLVCDSMEDVLAKGWLDALPVAEC